MKTIGNQSEETVLLKAFKYFDLSNTSLSDKQTFIRTMMKIGITGFTEDNIGDVFKIYDMDKTGKINYKDFIGILYNNPSIMENPDLLNILNIKKKDYPYAPSTHPPSQSHEGSKNLEQNFEYNKDEMSQSGMSKKNGEYKNNVIDDIIESIRSKIKKRGIKSLIRLENGFRALDDDNSQTIDFDAFEKIAQEFRFGLSIDELQQLFYFFDKDESGRIDYDEFVRIIRGEMNSFRKNLIEEIFNAIGPDKDGFIHINKLNQVYNPENHPDVLNGNLTPEEVFQEFVETFDGNHNYLNGDEAQIGNVELDEFCDYYNSISMIIDKDSEFENIVRGVWLNEVKKNYNKIEDKRIKPLKAKKIIKEDESQNGKEYDDEPKEEIKNVPKENPKKAEAKKGFEAFRKYLTQKGAKTVLTLARQFKIMDENGNKTIDFGEFCKGIRYADLDLSEEILQEIFSDFDYDGSGFISYDEFMVKLLGNMNKRREAVVRAAFNKIDLDKSGVVELNELKRFYNTKNNPQVLSGEISEEQLYSHFIETFGNHHNLYSGIRDKRVTWDEFLDYYRFISFNIPDDDLFEAILVSAWKLENTGDYIKSQRNDDIKKQRMIEHALEEKQESIRGRKNETSVRDGGAPFGVDKEPTDYSTSNMNDNAYLRNKKNIYKEQMDIKEGLTANSNDKYSQNYKKEYNTKYQPQKLNKYYNNESQGEEALNILKDIIRQRGTRGVFGMRRSFMIYDDENSKVLNFDNFNKYITSFLIPLTRNQIQALFKLYDKNRTGEILYDTLINDIVENLNDMRYNLISNAFNKMDKYKKGVLNMNVIKAEFNPRGHPDFVCGKKTEEEILSEFLDNFDYHFNLLNQGRNPDDEEVTKQEFIDFYRYISNGIEDDNYFNKMMSGVWGLKQEGKYKKYN
jgi:Ca2+-binding EF-hand superfamily protein